MGDVETAPVTQGAVPHRLHLLLPLAQHGTPLRIRVKTRADRAADSLTEIERRVQAALPSLPVRPELTTS